MAEFKKFKKKEEVLAYKWEGDAGSVPTASGVIAVAPGDYVVQVDVRDKVSTVIKKNADGSVLQVSEVNDHPQVAVVPGSQFEAEFEAD